MIGNTPGDGHRWLHTMVELLTGYLEGRVDVEWHDPLRLEVTLDWWDAGTSTSSSSPTTAAADLHGTGEKTDRRSACRTTRPWPPAHCWSGSASAECWARRHTLPWTSVAAAQRPRSER